MKVQNTKREQCECEKETSIQFYRQYKTNNIQVAMSSRNKSVTI